MAKKRKQPILLLTRSRGVWLLHSEHQSPVAAEDHWSRTIKGQGVTAWSWWGPRRIAEKMLADPNYNPDTEAIPVSEPQVEP